MLQLKLVQKKCTPKLFDLFIIIIIISIMIFVDITTT